MRQMTKGFFLPLFTLSALSAFTSAQTADNPPRQTTTKLLSDRSTSEATAAKPKRSAGNAGRFQNINAPFEPQLEKAEEFFKDFIAKGHPEPRNEFETREEYEARLPQPVDNSKPVYFEVDYWSSYSYDIDRQRLTLRGGEFDPSPFYHEYTPKNTLPFRIDTISEKQRDYLASNAFGVTTAVTEEESNDYYLHLTNGNSLPPALKTTETLPYSDTKQTRLTLSVTLPRDQAKAIAPRLILICGVKLISYSKSVSELSYMIKPTISSPTDKMSYIHGIDATLVSVHIIDKETKQELARWTSGK